MVLAAHNWRAADVPKGLSAMCRTRLCLRVVDTRAGGGAGGAGAGARGAGIQAPGRGVLRLDGRFQPVQTYRVTPEQFSGLQAWNRPRR